MCIRFTLWMVVVRSLMLCLLCLSCLSLFLRFPRNSSPRPLASRPVFCVVFSVPRWKAQLLVTRQCNIPLLLPRCGATHIFSAPCSPQRSPSASEPGRTCPCCESRRGCCGVIVSCGAFVPLFDCCCLVLGAVGLTGWMVYCWHAGGPRGAQPCKVWYPQPRR